MGNKSAAKSLMERAGVPLVPGYHGKQQDDATLQAAADRIGYPVLIKASAGGGGKGMRVVEHSADFAAQLVSCRREAAASFGDDAVLIEKYLTSPRHIELQVFADHHGNVVHLFERDCSVQRRHQKVLEEAPAPHLTQERREAMGAAAIAAARAVNYVGAGTVEFIVADDAGGFFFMEMNTRLQVEHPVTEMITGIDLVEWQLRVAAGEPLPRSAATITMRGHAIEARIYAENPDAGFLPDTGRLQHLAVPAASQVVRVDTGVVVGDTISPYYDPMIAKLIVWGETRANALARLARALSEYRIVGVANNIEFLRRLITTHSFANAKLDTRLIEREATALNAPNDTPERLAWLAAALAWLAKEARDSALAAERRQADGSPWWHSGGWRLHGSAHRSLRVQHGDRTCNIDIVYQFNERRADGWLATLEGANTMLRGSLQDDTRLFANIGERTLELTAVFTGTHVLHLFLPARRLRFEIEVPEDTSATGDDSEGHLCAPLPGRVIALLTKAGATVAKGAPLMVIEAMKMEHTIVAPRAGKIAAVHFDVGDSVQIDADLIEFVVAE